jgi:glycosyltransferase involved in cell wall biosynthesis
LPILNSSENLELKTLVGTNNLGINYPAEDIDALCNAMYLLNLNKENGQQMGANARAYAEKQLDRKVSYQALFNLFA